MMKHTFFRLLIILAIICKENVYCQWSIGKSSSSNSPTTKYAIDHSTALPTVLQRLSQASESLPSGLMTSAVENMQIVINLIRISNSKYILDVGTFAGFSAISMAMAIEGNGTVITMDISDQYWKQVGQTYANEAGLDSKIDKRLAAPARDTMNSLIQQGSRGKFDFCYIDADKSNYDTYYEQCLDLLRPLGIIVLDNVLWGGSVLNVRSNAGSSFIIDKLNTKIANDSRVFANLVTISDGIMIAVKRLSL